MHTMERVLYPDSETVAVLLRVWEASVRATHDFLSEEDILFLQPIVQDAIMSVEHLYCTKKENAIVAFMGVQDAKIEMLFVSPTERGKGVGKDLVAFALATLNANTVDISEQNSQAVGFFEHMGFAVFDRSELDKRVVLFPIVHMRTKT